jgi:sulfatase-modifying factor enzyme 1
VDAARRHCGVEAVVDGVFTSRFDLPASSVWTVVNRAFSPYEGPVLELGDQDESTGDRWFDLLTGQPTSVRRYDGRSLVLGRIPPRGVAALLRVAPGGEPPGLDQLLSRTAAEHARASTDDRFRVRRPRRVRPALARVRERPVEMGAVRPGVRELSIVHRRRETGLYDGAPYVDEWKPLPPRLHDRRRKLRRVELDPVFVQNLEVSNAEFAEFLAATDYRPAIDNRFLAHWVDGAPRPGTEDEPVVYVDLADARAYAAWRGWRLPTEGEWHAAAEDEVVQRRSPLVWNWTESEHSDGRTRFGMIKGGCWFRAEGSDWYLDGGPQPPEVTVKLLLLGGGLARSECIGFRCAADPATATGEPE